MESVFNTIILKKFNNVHLNLEVELIMISKINKHSILFYHGGILNTSL